MRWRLAVLVLVVLLAGCSGFTGSDVVGTETTTLTPVSVPERGTPVGATPSSPTPTPENRLLPGLTERGVTDPFALADAHRTALANETYTKTSRTRLVGSNGTLRVVERTVAVDAGGRRYHLVETSDSSPAYPVQSLTPRLEIWYADGPALFRLGTGENASYRVGMTSSLEGPVGDISGHDRLVGLYGTVDRWSVQQVVAGDGARILLESREAPDSDVLSLPILVTDPEDPKLWVVMTPDGRVVSHQLRYEAAFNDHPVEVVHHVEFSKVGTTTVTRPSWYDEAVGETTDDRRGEG